MNLKDSIDPLGASGGFLEGSFGPLEDSGGLLGN